MRFFSALATLLAISPAMVGTVPSLLSSSSGDVDRNDGVRAFIDANGNGSYDFGEKLVKGLDISLNFCQPEPESRQTYQCDQDVYGDELTTNPQWVAAPPQTTDSGNVSLQGDGTTMLEDVPINGGDENFPLIGEVKAVLPTGITSPLAKNGVIDIAMLKTGDTVGGPEASAIVLRNGYFLEGGFYTDEKRDQPQTRKWQLVDIPLSVSGTKNVIDAATPSEEALQKALSRGQPNFGAVVFDDAQGTGRFTANSTLIPGVGLSFGMCSRGGGGAYCEDESSMHDGFVSNDNGVPLTRTSKDRFISEVEVNSAEIQDAKFVENTWFHSIAVSSLPNGYEISTRPDDWQTARFTNQVDAASLGKPVILSQAGSQRAAITRRAAPGDPTVYIGHFNHANFISDPDASDPRSRIWNLAVVGLRKTAPAADKPAGFTQVPTDSTRGVLPAFRVWVDTNGNNAWDPADEPLIADLPVDLQECVRDGAASTWGPCESLADYRAATSAEGFLKSSHGDTAGDMWDSELPHTGPSELSEPFTEKVGDGRLRMIPAGYEIIPPRAAGVAPERASYADAEGNVAAPADDERYKFYESGYFANGHFVADADYQRPDVRIYKFYNVGLKPKALDVSIAPCKTAADGTCERPGIAQVTIANNTGIRHSDIAGSVELTLDGVTTIEPCEGASAVLEPGASTTCTLTYSPAAKAVRMSAKALTKSSVPLGSRVIPAVDASAAALGMFGVAPTTPVTTAPTAPGQPGNSGSSGQQGQAGHTGHGGHATSPSRASGSKADGSLPYTGAAISGGVIVAIVMIVLGFIATRFARARRAARAE